MELIGEYLKGIRLDSQISLDELSNELNISLDNLKLIESDDYSNNLNKVYRIGYIRSISQYFNLNANEIVSKYKDQISFSLNNKNIEIPKPLTSFNFFLSYKLVSLISVASLSFAFYFMFINNNNIVPNYAITPDISENLQSEIEQIELENALSELQKEKNNTSINQHNKIYISNDLPKIIDTTNTNTGAAIASLPEDLDNIDIRNTITIKSLESTWIQIRDEDNQIVFSKLMKNNEEFSYSQTKKYKITAGNAGNLLISLNGDIVGKLGKKGEVIESIVISADLFL